MFELAPFGRRNNMMNPFGMLDDFDNFFRHEDLTKIFKTDIKEEDDAYILEADLPGFDKKDIQIDIENGYLTINAERHSDAEEKDKQGNYVRCERSYGAYARSFDVSNIKTEEIKAEYKDGVLKLKMPKEKELPPKSRRLEIE